MEQFMNECQSLKGLRRGQIWTYLNLFAGLLSDEGYAPATIRMQVLIIADFARWLKARGLALRHLTSRHVRSYVRYRDRNELSQRSTALSALNRFFNVLSRHGIVANDVSPVAVTSTDKILEAYCNYLSAERRLAPATVCRYRKLVQSFLRDQFAGRRKRLANLCVSDVTGFVQRQAAALSVIQCKHVTTVLRSFFLYARYQGLIGSDLTTAVPKVANWSKASLPKALPKDQVELVLSSCERNTTIGRRNYAILLLLARLGLRAGEVAALKLEDIDWHAGKLAIHGKSGYRPCLPLPVEVGEAIAAYLFDGRPRTPSRSVFLRTKAPIRGFKGAGAVCRVVGQALVHARINTLRKGAHQFRHGLATELLRNGASLSEIGELLGHRHLQTTTIYAKVDLDSLRSLAMAWPGGEQ